LVPFLNETVQRKNGLLFKGGVCAIYSAAEFTVPSIIERENS
jgi:hypothetical protein